MAKVKLGKKYRDKVNGFEGTAISTQEWLHSCTRVTLSAMHDGDIKEFTFDEPQLEEVNGVRHQPTSRSLVTGGGSAKANPSR